MANKGKRMLFEEDYNYVIDLKENHPDPSAEWGGGSGGDVNIEAGTGITITTESDDTKVISLDTTPSTFEVTTSTGTTLEVTNANPLYKDAKLQMTSAGSTRVEGATIDIEANNIYLHSDTAPYYVNNTSHEYKTLATTDQLFSGNYNDLTNKPTIPDAVSGTNDGINWTSLTIGEDTYGLASGGTTYTAGTGIDITNDTISVDNTVAMKTDIPTNYVTTDTDQTISGQKTYSNNYYVINDKKLTFYNSSVASYNKKSEIKSDGIIYTTSLSGQKYRVKVSMPVDGATVSQNYYFPTPTGTTSREIAMVDQIPDAVSGTNDGTNWTSLTIGNDTYGLASGGGTSYSAGTGIDITGSTISIDTNVVAEVSDIPTDLSDLNNDVGYITGITSSDVTTALGYTPYDSSNPSGYITGITSSDVTTALGYTPGTSNFSGDYDDLTNKPTIPTSTSQLTNDSGFITSSDLPTNYVTTNTAQDITGAKTFKTNPITIVNNNKGLKLLSGANDSNSAKLGFTLYNSKTDDSERECGFLEANTSTNNGKNVLLGYYNTTGNTATKYADWDLGFGYAAYNSNKGSNVQYKLLVPNQYNLNSYNTKRYIPIDFTDGTNTVRSDATGVVNISTLLPNEVTANTGSTPSATLTDIQVGSTVYSIPQGGSTPTNMVTTDTAQDITANKSFVGSNIYVQSGATYTSSDTMITDSMVSASTIDGTTVSAGQLSLSDSTTAGHSQIRVRDFSQGVPFTDYTIEVPTKNGTMALTSDIPTVPTYTTLFSNSSGSDALSISLSDSVANYNCVDIQWINNDGITNSTRVYEPNEKTVNLLSANILSTLYIDKVGIYSLSGTTMTQVSKGQGTMVNGGNSSVDYKNNTQTSAYIKITKVIGIKY